MAFEAQEELMRLSRQVQAAHAAYYAALEASTNFSDALEAQAALDTAFAHLRACWEQKGTDEEIRKHSG